MKSRYQYLIVALAGLAGGFAFPPLHLGFLAFLCFLPLIAVIEQRQFKGNLTALLYVFFFCFHGAANWWVMSWQKETDPYLMAAGAGLWLGHPFFLMPAFWVYQYIRRRSRSLILALTSLVVAWTAVEWLHSLTDLSYPWLSLGYTQVYNTILIQIADLGGVWFVSAFVMSINVILAHYYLTKSSVWKHFALAVSIIFIVSVYGVAPPLIGWGPEDPQRYADDYRTITVGVVQPSIDPWEKWQGGINDMISLHQSLQDSLNSVQHCDMSVWSETAIPYGLTLPENVSLLNRLQNWVDTSHTALLSGFADYEMYSPGSAPANAQRMLRDPLHLVKVYNAAGIITPGYTDLPRHHKSRLTPFGEYMPFSDDFPVIQSWLKWGVGISGWNKGAGATVLPLRRGKDTLAMIGPVICIESIYPSHVADYVRRGATMLAVITNDAWYDGTFGPEQHYCISRMRAVETHTPIVRCGNSGISGMIDEHGRSVVQAEARKRCALACTLDRPGVKHKTRLSLYTHWGDWLPELCTALSVILLLWLRFKARSKAAA